MGTAFSSKLIIDENKSSGGFGVNHTEAEIDTIVKKFLGVNRYIKMDKLPYDGIHHIDMHMKLLDEETLIVGEYPAGISDGPQIEANLQYVLANFKTAFGTDYRVVRVPMPVFLLLSRCWACAACIAADDGHGVCRRRFAVDGFVAIEPILAHGIAQRGSGGFVCVEAACDRHGMGFIAQILCGFARRVADMGDAVAFLANAAQYNAGITANAAQRQ
jgi:hypothetical protein